ncbi:MAG: hypothetical protein J3Q66DRAFT_402518 [Benniella sp.]|nr:MAG: hypothetical protein J3Q66DRAFT_402518 [Benniella sp.]
MATAISELDVFKETSHEDDHKTVRGKCEVLERSARSKPESAGSKAHTKAKQLMKQAEDIHDAEVKFHSNLGSTVSRDRLIGSGCNFAVEISGTIFTNVGGQLRDPATSLEIGFSDRQCSKTKRFPDEQTWDLGMAIATHPMYQCPSKLACSRHLVAHNQHHSLKSKASKQTSHTDEEGIKVTDSGSHGAKILNTADAKVGIHIADPVKLLEATAKVASIVDQAELDAPSMSIGPDHTNHAPLRTFGFGNTSRTHRFKLALTNGYGELKCTLMLLVVLHRIESTRLSGRISSASGNPRLIKVMESSISVQGHTVTRGRFLNSSRYTGCTYGGCYAGNKANSSDVMRSVKYVMVDTDGGTKSGFQRSYRGPKTSIYQSSAPRLLLETQDFSIVPYSVDDTNIARAFKRYQATSLPLVNNHATMATIYNISKFMYVNYEIRNLRLWPRSLSN